MSSTRFDFTFGRSGATNRTYINNEEFRQIDYIAGWDNSKIVAEVQHGESKLDLKPGRNNYIRTCLENNFAQNSVYNRANSYPFCFSDDAEITDVPTGQRTLKALPRFNIKNPNGSTVSLLGMQSYVCPKKNNAYWPQDYYTLKQTKSNSQWPIRPSNGDGAKLEYSPPKPYHTRIRIKLTDFKWTYYDTNKNGQKIKVEKNIFENEYTSGTSDQTINGEFVQVTKIRGFINLINPDAINSTTNSSGNNTWPHAFNQIYYRVTSDDFGGDDSTPIITILNSECAGNANIAGGQPNRTSSFYGSGVPFEIPILENQRYLIFDIYTDICDNSVYNTSASTQWWQMTWTFESIMYRPIDTAGIIPVFKLVRNPDITSRYYKNQRGWPRNNYYWEWPINHELQSEEISLDVYDSYGPVSVNSNGEILKIGPVSYYTKINVDYKVVDINNIIIKIRASSPNEILESNRYLAFIIAGNRYGNEF